MLSRSSKIVTSATPTPRKIGSISVSGIVRLLQLYGCIVLARSLQGRKTRQCPLMFQELNRDIRNRQQNADGTSSESGVTGQPAIRRLHPAGGHNLIQENSDRHVPAALDLA